MLQGLVSPPQQLTQASLACWPVQGMNPARDLGPRIVTLYRLVRDTQRCSWGSSIETGLMITIY